MLPYTTSVSRNALSGAYAPYANACLVPGNEPCECKDAGVDILGEMFDHFFRSTTQRLRRKEHLIWLRMNHPSLGRSRC